MLYFNVFDNQIKLLRAKYFFFYTNTNIYDLTSFQNNVKFILKLIFVNKTIFLVRE